MNNWFQTDVCLDFYRSLGFVETFCCEVRRGDALKGRIAGYIQKDGGRVKGFLSRRAVVNGGPMLAADITGSEIAELLSLCRRTLKGKAIYVEFRNFEDYSAYRRLFEQNGFAYLPHYNFHVDTASADTVERNLGKSRKRDIRTSLRDGASVGPAQNLVEVRQLYGILERLYRTRVKTPLFPLSFFERLYAAPFGRFLLVRYNGKVIGGTVCVAGDGVMYEWFACGEDGVYKNIYPSTLATYAGIQEAVACRCRRFDMMGAGAPGDGGYGVRDFKAKFGGELVEHGRFRCVLDRPLFAIGNIGVKILKKL